jgi:hypothetical protein
MDGWMGGWMGGWMDGWMGGWVDRMDGWMDTEGQNILPKLSAIRSLTLCREMNPS